jgi:hypothetical protein
MMNVAETELKENEITEKRLRNTYGKLESQLKKEKKVLAKETKKRKGNTSVSSTEVSVIIDQK